MEEEGSRNVSSEWSCDQVFELIKQAESRAALWAFRHSDYKNWDVRRTLYEEIAPILNKDTEDVIVKWRNLCSQYFRELRKISRRNGNSAKWKYFDALRFLSDEEDESVSGSALSTDSGEAVEQTVTISSDLLMMMVERISKSVDEVETFANYVVATLRQLPPRIASRIMMEINQKLLLAQEETLESELGQDREM